MNLKVKLLCILIIVITTSLLLTSIFVLFNAFQETRKAYELREYVCAGDCDKTEAFLKESPQSVNVFPSYFPTYARRIFVCFDYDVNLYALQQACFNRDHEMIELLLNYGADCNLVGSDLMLYEGYSPLELFIRQGSDYELDKFGEDERDYKTVEILLQHGADPYWHYKDGTELYTLVVEHGDEHLIELFNKYRVDFHII